MDPTAIMVPQVITTMWPVLVHGLFYRGHFVSLTVFGGVRVAYFFSFLYCALFLLLLCLISVSCELILPVYLDCLFFILISVFSNVHCTYY